MDGYELFFLLIWVGWWCIFFVIRYSLGYSLLLVGIYYYGEVFFYIKLGKRFLDIV